MAFIKFTLTGRSFIPKASIWSRGQIGLNNGAITRYSLNNYQYAVFYFDEEENKVGIRFSNKEDEEGAVKFTVRKSGATIGAKAFLDCYAIDYSETRQYDFKHDKENDIYVIDLNNESKSK